jgi:hypothetical protein
MFGLRIGDWRTGIWKASGIPDKKTFIDNSKV